MEWILSGHATNYLVMMHGGWMLGQRNGIHNAWGMDLVEEWVAIPLPPHAL